MVFLYTNDKHLEYDIVKQLHLYYHPKVQYLEINLVKYVQVFDCFHQCFVFFCIQILHLAFTTIIVLIVQVREPT